ncbi:MAG TPA: AarF/UbiB family protein [Terriglobales bacterium]|nr:AarF/UbiB family protein [Terriglobales bacterium]
MLSASTSKPESLQFTPEQLRGKLSDFLPQGASIAAKTAAVEVALRSPMGESLRGAMARWVVEQITPVERLVPAAYEKWQSPVRDSMMFVVQRLSAARLAPKLVEQFEIPQNTSAEDRLLLLIARVPGLQKLGQVIARNQHLRPALRKALARLENGIRDVNIGEIRELIKKQLGGQLQKYNVEIASSILSEASVSAVVRFTWEDPETGERKRGVFKVLKPHIPEYFAEDMEYLQGLAQYFGDRHHRYAFPAHLIPDTFRKVRRLLQHEVNFRREQKTLREAAALYRDHPGVRVPEVIPFLCTPTITALTEEHGIKVTNAASRLPSAARNRIAEQLVEALVAVPLLTATEEAVFHGDPHAGNLLYDTRARKLVIIDWALRERLSREQRRHLALLFLMVSIRDPIGAANEVLALSSPRIHAGSQKAHAIRIVVQQFVDEFPVKYLPSVGDAMRLLEKIAIQGVRFPSPLVMLSKVMFTLDGLIADVRGESAGIGFTVARHVAQHWVIHRKGFRSPLKMSDWVTLQCSALLYPTRLWLNYEQKLLDRYLPSHAASLA